MYPLVMIAMQLMAKKKQQEAERQQEQERLANERAAESGGDTKVAHANAFTRSQGQQNFGTAASLYGAFAGENPGTAAANEDAADVAYNKSHDFDGAEGYDWKKGAQVRGRYGL